MPSPSDIAFLRRALACAARGEGHTRPNPPVGAVLARNGEILGEGWHRRAGGDHAEVAAIRDARRKLARRGAKNPTFENATLYVTLEPCSKPGRVGACTDAIAAAKIGRVVYLLPDPNPKNRGKATRALARAGIPCTCASKVPGGRMAGSDREELKQLIADAKRLLEPFAKHVTTGLPLVTVKLAMSLDGRICDRAGDAKWISSARSRRLTGEMRARVDAILVGAETVRKDDPSLLCHSSRNDDLVRVVITRSGRLPEKARIFTDGKNPTRVYANYRGDGDVPAPGFLKTVLADLGAKGIMHVLCEGGLKLATALADAGLVDRWVLVTAPIVLGSRPIAEARRFSVVESGFSDERAGDRIGRYSCSRD